MGIRGGRTTSTRAVDIVVDDDVPDMLGREDSGRQRVRQIARGEPDRLVSREHQRRALLGDRETRLSVELLVPLVTFRDVPRAWADARIRRDDALGLRGEPVDPLWTGGRVEDRHRGGQKLEGDRGEGHNGDELPATTLARRESGKRQRRKNRGGELREQANSRVHAPVGRDLRKQPGGHGDRNSRQMLGWSERGEERHRSQNEGEHGGPPARIGNPQARISPIDKHRGDHCKRERRVAEEERLLREVGGMESQEAVDRPRSSEPAEQRVVRRGHEKGSERCCVVREIAHRPADRRPDTRPLREVEPEDRSQQDEHHRVRHGPERRRPEPDSPSPGPDDLDREEHEGHQRCQKPLVGTHVEREPDRRTDGCRTCKCSPGGDLEQRRQHEHEDPVLDQAEMAGLDAFDRVRPEREHEPGEHRGDKRASEPVEKREHRHPRSEEP